jgi:hypothetical protein
MSTIHRFKHLVSFYSLATLLPWSCWFAAGYISHLTPFRDSYMVVASVLGLIGLISPLVLAFWFISRDSDLQKDLWNRLVNFKSVKPVYFYLACLIMPVSILLAQAISLVFG